MQQTKDEEPFEPPFKNKGIYVNPHVKSIVDIYAGIADIQAHACNLGKGDKYADGAGEIHDSYFYELPVSPGPYGSHGAYILHRLQRSEQEYLAIVIKPSLEEGNRRIRLGRYGFKDNVDTWMTISEQNETKYVNSLNKFVTHCKLNDALSRSRKKLLDSNTCIPMLTDAELPVQDRIMLRSALAGTKLLDTFAMVETKGVNIAPNAVCTQSSFSEWSSSNQETSAVVDGNRTGSFSFHTDFESKPWLLLEFPECVKFDEIIIFNQMHAPQRAKFLGVEISIDSAGWFQVYHSNGNENFGGIDGNPLRIKCKDYEARFIRIFLEQPGYLCLDSVEVYRYQNAHLFHRLYRMGFQCGLFDSVRPLLRLKLLSLAQLFDTA